MLFQNFRKSSVNVSKLNEALGILYSIGYLGVGLELAISRCGDLNGSDLINRAAIQRGFAEGYKECLMDLFNFTERYVNAPEEKKVNADFGASTTLVENNQLTKEEVDEFISRYRNTGRG